MTFHRWRAAALIVALAVALDVGAAQIIKRIWPGWYVLTPANNVRVPSEIFHHGLRPSMDVMHREFGRRYRFATNSLAMVDGAPRQVKLKGHPCRVLFIGDSMTEGYGVGWPHSFAGLLAERWKERGVEVLNAAVAGASPSIYYRRVRSLIEDTGLQFDQLFVAIDMSDIRDEWLNYDLDDAERVVQISNEFPSAMIRPPAIGDQVAFILIDNSFVARTSHAALSRLGLSPKYTIDIVPGLPPVDLRPHRAPLPLPYGSIEMQPTFPDSVNRLPGYFVSRYGYWTVDEKDWNEFGRNGLQVAAERMDRLRALLEANNVRLAVSTHPWPSNIATGDSNSVQMRFWREWARTRNASFVDLFQPFLAGGSEMIATHYIAGDVHWNERGHRLVADEIHRTYDPLAGCSARGPRS